VESRAGINSVSFARPHRQAVFGFLLPFSIVLYLALKGGGYDPIARGEFGVVIWWMVLLGSAAGALSTAGLSRAAWTLLGLFGAFAIWTGLGIIWSESSERSVIELARVATYGGVLVLGLTVGTREALKRTVAGIASALALVALLALASRLHPQWFPANEAAAFLPETIKRLNYPVGYWNGLAALVAIGVPLMLWLATAAQRVAVRAVAAGVIPAMVLTAFLTLSRGGAVELAVALTAFLALHPRRFTLLPTAFNVGLGGMALVWAASRREELADGLSTPAAASQADQMILIVLGVCLAVGLVEWAIVVAGRRGFGPRPAFSRRTAFRALGIGAAVVVVLGLALGAPGKISDGWQEFKAPSGPASGDTIQRFSSASGNGRYQYWSTAVDAGKDEPLTGTGPGTYEFLWAKDGTLPSFVRDAHSLYLETFAELGIVGFGLVLGLMVFVLAVACRRALAADPERRVVLAAAAASCAAFVAGATLDWSWELPVIPIAFLLIVAAVFTADRPPPPAFGRVPASDRIALATLALLAAAAVALPLPAAISIRSSQESVNAGDLPRALEQAETAQHWQPYAAAPRLQEALVLERQGELGSARDAAAEAVERESSNWRNWLVLSRLEARLGNAEASVYAYRKARDLNPRSPLFAS
jgi:hypothetical protein